MNKTVSFSMTDDVYKVLLFEATSKGLPLSAYCKMAAYSYANKYPVSGSVANMMRASMNHELRTKETITQEMIDKIRNVDPNRLPGKVSDGTGYVYLLYVNDDRSLFKIGKSTDIDGKVKSIRAQANTVATIVYAIKVDQPSRIEKELHDHFDSLRVHGEWLALGEFEVKSFPKLVTILLRGNDHSALTALGVQGKKSEVTDN